jgi:hypothetical protein
LAALFIEVTIILIHGRLCFVGVLGISELEILAPDELQPEDLFPSADPPHRHEGLYIS